MNRMRRHYTLRPSKKMNAAAERRCFSGAALERGAKVRRPEGPHDPSRRSEKGQNDAAPCEALQDAMLKGGPKVGNWKEKDQE